MLLSINAGSSLSVLSGPIVAYQKGSRWHQYFFRKKRGKNITFTWEDSWRSRLLLHDWKNQLGTMIQQSKDSDKLVISSERKSSSGFAKLHAAIGISPPIIFDLPVETWLPSFCNRMIRQFPGLQTDMSGQETYIRGIPPASTFNDSIVFLDETPLH